MAKPIKFNMKVDSVPVRTMEELIEHFNISDVVELYESGTLLRWLQARDYLDHAEKLLQIDTAAPLEEKAKALCSAFGFAPEETQRAISDMLHTRQREAALKEYAQDAASVDKIIANYLTDYEKLKEDIKAHSADEDFIKSAVEQLASVYQPILQYDGNKFYAELKNVRQSYSLITKQLRLNQTTRAYLYLTNSFGQIFSPTAFSMLIESMMDDYPNDLIALKRAADQIAQNYMPEFEQQWERLFNEIKEDYPLMFYALCMNKKINTFIFKNIQDCDKYNNFLHPTDNIRRQCSGYIKSITSTQGSSHYTSESKGNVLVVFFSNAEIREASDRTAVCQRINKLGQATLQQNDWVNPDGIRAAFFLFNSLEYIFYRNGGEILYMEVPETDATAQA